MAKKILFTAPYNIKVKAKQNKTKKQKEILPQQKKSFHHPPNGIHKKYFKEALIMKGWYLCSSE